MRRLTLAIVTSLAWFAASQSVVAQGADGSAGEAGSDSSSRASTGPDWITTCTGSARASVADCTIQQRVFLSETGQLFGGMSIRVPADTRAPVMMLQLPLGLFLPAGVSLAVDGGVAESLEIQTCEASGCYAGSPVSADILAAMKNGSQLVVTFQNTQRTEIRMPISLSGFTAAYGGIE